MHMEMTDHAANSPRADVAQLEAFCARVLDDPSLQQQLRGPDGADDGFIPVVLDAARRRGFALGAEAMRARMAERALGIEVLLANNVRQTRPPPDGWLPIRASWAGDAPYLHWAHFGARRLTRPFFEDDVRACLAQPFNRLFGYVTSIEKTAEWLDGRPHLKPSGLVFHMSRCGSTLVSQMLAALPSNIVVSEANPIDTVLQAPFWRPEASADRKARWLAAVVGALGQQRRGDERCYFLKLDCWHTLALPLFRRAFPEAPWVFLYRDPVEVMVSQAGMPGTQMMPQRIGPNLYGIERCYGPGAEEDYYARVLAKVCEPAVRHYGEGGGLLVNYRELPQALFTAILPHFGVECSAADCAAMAAAARYDAKTPGMAFSADSVAKQLKATATIRAAAERWLDDPYRRLEALRTGTA
jgi:hypothetical protein